MRRSWPVAVVFLLICQTAHAQFGVFKKKVTLYVRQAPELYIPGHRVQLEVQSAVSTGHEPAAQLQAFLEKELQRANFDLGSGQPETRLRLVVTRFDPRAPYHVREESRHVHTGYHTEHNKKGEPYEVEDCAWKKVNVAHVLANGSLAVSLTLTDLATNTQLESLTLPTHYTRDVAIAGPLLCKDAAYESLSPAEVDPVSLGNHLVRLLIPALQQKLFGTTEPVEVLLATPDELKPGNRFAMANLWPQALELWSRAAINEQKTEAYRQYNLGVAYEALSYTLPDLNEAATHMQKAETAYNKAMELYSKEEYFQAAFVRVNSGQLALQRRQEQNAQRRLEAENQTVEQQEKTGPGDMAGRGVSPEEETEETRNFRDYARLRISRLRPDVSQEEREALVEDGVIFGLDRNTAEGVVDGEKERARASLGRFLEFYEEC